MKKEIINGLYTEERRGIVKTKENKFLKLIIHLVPMF